MSLVGKIVAVFNIVFVIAFLALASIDWGKRQQWGYGAYRLDLAADGLPVDEEDRDFQFGPQVERLSDTTLKDAFGRTGGPPVKTQVEEVQRIHNDLVNQVNQAGDDAARRQKLRDILLPLARSKQERDALADQLNKTPVGDLTGPNGPFEREFARASGATNEQGKRRDTAERRRAIAHLLYNTAQTDDQWKRAQVVCGLQAFTDEANRQAEALRTMATPIELAIADDLAHFEQEYRRSTGDLQVLAEQLRDAQAELNKQKDLVAKHQVLVNSRKGEVQKIQGAIEETRQVARQELEKLASDQQHLFDVQRKVARALAENLRLETEIRNLERGK